MEEKNSYIYIPLRPNQLVRSWKKKRKGYYILNQEAITYLDNNDNDNNTDDNINNDVGKLYTKHSHQIIYTLKEKWHTF